VTAQAAAPSANGASPSTREEPAPPLDLDAKAEASGLPRVLIAGGGIGGLVAAVALIKRGYPVQVFERDLTAIRGEGKYRGPIQIQSNALAALEAIDQDMAESILEEGCVTGDRINGLCDGVTGDWYVKFDTFHPAVDIGLPVTRVISRVVLQRKLAEKAEELEGQGVLANDCHVVDYEESVSPKTGRKVVTAILDDGRRFEGDILIGADGIWSKVRRKLVGESQPSYSQYTCYTGISDFTPPDIDTVGYRVFLGNGLLRVQRCGRRQDAVVRLPQGACRRQGRAGRAEEAAAGDLWRLGGRSHGPHPRDAGGRRAAPRHLRPAAHLQVDAGARGAAGRLRARDAAQSRPGWVHGHRGRLPVLPYPGRGGAVGAAGRAGGH
jgi:2-polyprenyl-6-methoxyphenol hydroxylase-like FAD-dependent oxidoreductase